jgi:hypothetical protein
MLHPIHDLAVETFLNGNMRHRGSGRRAVPMFLAGRKPNHITRPDFFNRTAPTLCPPETCRDNERLSKRMSVPSRASAGSKVTLAPAARAGSGDWNNESMRTVPVK